jgi:hypothetical protein
MNQDAIAAAATAVAEEAYRLSEYRAFSSAVERPLASFVTTFRAIHDDYSHLPVKAYTSYGTGRGTGPAAHASTITTAVMLFSLTIICLYSIMSDYRRHAFMYVSSLSQFFFPIILILCQATRPFSGTVCW